MRCMPSSCMFSQVTLLTIFGQIHYPQILVYSTLRLLPFPNCVQPRSKILPYLYTHYFLPLELFSISIMRRNIMARLHAIQIARSSARFRGGPATPTIWPNNMTPRCLATDMPEWLDSWFFRRQSNGLWYIFVVLGSAWLGFFLLFFLLFNGLYVFASDDTMPFV